MDFYGRWQSDLRSEQLEPRLALTSSVLGIAFVEPQHHALPSDAFVNFAKTVDLNGDDQVDLVTSGLILDSESTDVRSVIEGFAATSDGYERLFQLDGYVDDVFAGDIQGNGDTELLGMTAEGLVYWRAAPAEGDFLFEDPILLTEDTVLRVVEDLNSDGRVDVVTQATDELRVLLQPETGFAPAPVDEGEPENATTSDEQPGENKGPLDDVEQPEVRPNLDDSDTPTSSEDIDLISQDNVSPVEPDAVAGDTSSMDESESNSFTDASGEPGSSDVDSSDDQEPATDGKPASHGESQTNPLRYPFQSEVSAGDWDADGDIDLVTICRSDECEHTDKFVLLLNDGTGAFPETRAITDTLLALEEPIFFLEDANLDERLDLVFVTADAVVSRDADGPASRIHVAYQHESTLIADMETIDLPKQVDRLALQDFNGDGKLDLVTSQTTDKTVERPAQTSAQVLLGVGGSFQPPIDVPLDGNATVLDLSQNAKLLTLSATGVEEHSGDYVGSFLNSAEVVSADFEPGSAQILDVNGDGLADVLARRDSRLEFLFGTHTGRYKHSSLALGLTSVRTFVDEFDAEPGQDIVAVGTDPNGNTRVVRVGLINEVPFIAGTEDAEDAIVIESADLDADGIVDFVFRSPFQAVQEYSFVLLSRSDRWIRSDISDSVATVGLEDLDGDGRQEVFVFEDPMRIFRYADDAYMPWGTVAKGTTRATVADFDGDSLQDFLSITKTSAGTSLVVHRNNGDGTWHAWDNILANSHELVDVNNDGLLDIASPRHFYLAAGDGSWLPSDELVSDSPEWAERNQFLDFNGDGLIDNVKLHVITNSLTFHQFSDEGEWTVTDYDDLVGWSFELADLNADGMSDILERTNSGLVITFREGESWSDPRVLNSDLREYQIIDRNEDSLSDLALLSFDSVSYFLQTESGEFVLSDELEVGFNKIADVNNDGFLDLTSEDDDLWNPSTTVRHGAPTGFLDPKEFPAGKGVRWSEPALLQFGEGTQMPRSSRLSFPTQLTTNPVFSTTQLDADDDGDLDTLLLSQSELVIIRGIGHGDLDANGLIDHRDLEVLRVAVADATSESESFDAAFDLNGDGELDSGDTDFWISEIAKTRLADADLDRDVDFRDFLQFSRGFGTTEATWRDGDFDGDFEVTFVDFLILAKEFGKFGPSD